MGRHLESHSFRCPVCILGLRVQTQKIVIRRKGKPFKGIRATPGTLCAMSSVGHRKPEPQTRATCLRGILGSQPGWWMREQNKETVKNKKSNNSNKKVSLVVLMKARETWSHHNLRAVLLWHFSTKKQEVRLEYNSGSNCFYADHSSVPRMHVTSGALCAQALWPVSLASRNGCLTKQDEKAKQNTQGRQLRRSETWGCRPFSTCVFMYMCNPPNTKVKFLKNSKRYFEIKKWEEVVKSTHWQPPLVESAHLGCLHGRCTCQYDTKHFRLWARERTWT